MSKGETLRKKLVLHESAGHRTGRFAPSDALDIVHHVERPPRSGICFSCGDDLSDPLRRSGSLRCHDCRDACAPLDPELVEPPAQKPAEPPKKRRRRLLRRAA
jgi:hypothetical protein